MSRTVAEAMSEEPCSVSSERAVREAAKVMLAEGVGSVPIVDEHNTLLGIITDRDIAIRVVAEGLDPSTTKVGTVASSDLHAVAPHESLDDAYERMTTWQIRRLPVVEAGRLVGMLAEADLVHELKDKKAGQLVDEISKPGDPSFREQTVGIG